MEWIFTILKWIAYFFLGLFALYFLGLVIDLIYRVWHQVILGEIRIDADQGAMEFCEVANEILGRKKKIDSGTYLKPAEYELVSRELKRRYELERQAKSRERAS